LKRLMLMIFLTALPMLTFSMEKSTESKNDFGIDSNNVYQGSFVLEMLEAAAEESEASIDEAYSEGYKAGMKRSAGEAAYWESRATGAEKREAEKVEVIDSYGWKLPAAAGGGFLTGCGLTLLIFFVSGLASASK